MQIDFLTTDSVYTLSVIDGENHRKAYVNDTAGRADLVAECPPELVTEVLAVWGDTPTVTTEPAQAEAILQTTANKA